MHICNIYKITIVCFCKIRCINNAQINRSCVFARPVHKELAISDFISVIMRGRIHADRRCAYTRTPDSHDVNYFCNLMQNHHLFNTFFVNVCTFIFRLVAAQDCQWCLCCVYIVNTESCLPITGVPLIVSARARLTAPRAHL